MRLRRRRKALPINARNEPLPLVNTEFTYRIARLGPDKMAAMQATLTQPDAIAIPANEFHSRASSIGKNIGRSIAGRAAERLLYLQGQAIDAKTHIDWRNSQPYCIRLQPHRRLCNSAPSQAAGTLRAIFTVQPLGLCSVSTGAWLSGATGFTLTGIN